MFRPYGTGGLGGFLCFTDILCLTAHDGLIIRDLIPPNFLAYKWVFSKSNPGGIKYR